MSRVRQIYKGLTKWRRLGQNVKDATICTNGIFTHGDAGMHNYARMHKHPASTQGMMIPSSIVNNMWINDVGAT
jgi:hypothetical protein